MNLLQKIGLSGRWGKVFYIISAIVTVCYAATAVAVPILVATLLLLKILSIPIILYLYISTQNKVTIYFYINLGVSRMEYYLIPAVVEFAAFLILIILSGSIGYAIR